MEVNDIMEVKVYCTFGDQTSVNVLHYLVATKAGAGATAGQIAGAISTKIHGEYKACMSADAVFWGVGAARIFPVASPQAVTNANQGVGSDAGDALPRQVCGLITKVTPFAGRKFRGRVYVAFPSELSNEDEGKVTGTYKTTLGVLGQALIDPVTADPGGGNTNELVPIIWHKESETYTIITGYLARERWATQRRRGDYGNPNLPPA